MRRQRILIFFLSLLAAYPAGNGGNLGADVFFPRAPFQINERLLPDLAEMNYWKNLPFQDTISDKRMTHPQENGDRGIAPLRNEVRFRKFSLFVSRQTTMQPKWDLVGPGKRRDGVVDAVRSFGGIMQDNPSHAFKMFGEIFEPHLNLGIEF